MECKYALRCECTGLDKIYANANRNPFDLVAMKDWEASKPWFEVVKEYVVSSLSCAKDRLIAISGIAIVFQKRQKSAYLAEISEIDIARGLLWTIWRTMKIRETNFMSCTPKPRVKGYFASSWSWASAILEQHDVIDFFATDDSKSTAHEAFSCIGTTIPFSVTDFLEETALIYVEFKGLVVQEQLSYRASDKDQGIKVPGISFEQVSNDFHSRFGLNLDFLLRIVGIDVNETSPIYCLLVGTVVESEYLDSPSQNGTASWTCFHALLFETSDLEPNFYKQAGTLRLLEDAKVFLDAVQMPIKLIRCYFYLLW